MIFIVFLAVVVVVFLYLCGCLAFNARQFDVLYVERVAEPWREAINTSTTVPDPKLEHWKQVSTNFEFGTWKHILNPISWIRYWNWIPPQPPVRELVKRVATRRP